MADQKKIELFVYYRDGYDETYISTKMPVLVDGGLGEEGEDDDNTRMGLCEKGLKVFGLRPLKGGDNKIIKLTLAVEAVEVAEYEIKAEFKPFVATPKRTRRRRR